MAGRRSNPQQSSQSAYQVEKHAALPDPEKKVSFNQVESFVIIHLSGYHQDPAYETGLYVVDSGHHFFGRQRRTSQVKEDRVIILGTNHRQRLPAISGHLTLATQVLDHNPQQLPGNGFALDQKYLATFGDSFHRQHDYRFEFLLTPGDWGPYSERSRR